MDSTMKRLLFGLLFATLFVQGHSAARDDVPALLAPRNAVEERVAGGSLAAEGQFPWHVTLITDGYGFCNGALLDTLWVLTSAHCAHRVTNFSVTLGMTDLITTEENDTLLVHTTLKYVHPLFDERTLLNDIALLKFETPLELTNSADALIAPIGISSLTEEELDGIEVQLSGWGKTSENAEHPISKSLSFVNLTVTSLTDCRAAFGMANIYGGMMCTSGEGGRGACAGDDGSPLVLWNGNTWRLVGIASFAATHGCEQGAPTVYSRTSAYRDWIYCQKDPETLDPLDCVSGASATVGSTIFSALMSAIILRYAFGGC